MGRHGGAPEGRGIARILGARADEASRAEHCNACFDASTYDVCRCETCSNTLIDSESRV